jgi:hypothetical protein
MLGWKGTTPTADDGRFSCVVCPKLVALDSSSTYSNLVMKDLADVLRETPVTSGDAWYPGYGINTYVRQFDDNANIMCPSFTVRDGLAEKARAVSQSVWAEYEGPTLNDGGSIAAMLAPSDVWGHHCSPASFVPYARWENLANAPGAYQGRVREGCYVTWRPQGLGDAMFWDTDAANGSDSMQFAQYPIIIISGILPPTTDGQAPIVRVRVVTNYEILTSSRVLVSTPSPVCTAQLEVAAQAYIGQPAAMPNDSHMSWIATILKIGVGAAAGFVLGGGLPGAAVGALAGAGITIPGMK